MGKAGSTDECASCGEKLDPAWIGALCPACILSAALRPDGRENLDGWDTVTVRADPERPAPPAPAASSLPSAIGPYRVVRLLGSGGMGEVHLAEQDQPVRRRVALKVLRPGLASPELRERFAAERQMLALMDHPDIAKVYDAGETPDGSPYLVMEFVDGAPLADYCDRASLSLDDRLVLFRKICLAVAHAHQKAILHRDLKPSNILVSEQDGIPEPKLIDFGIGKALGWKIEQLSIETLQGQVFGTPQYMSPEHGLGRGGALDTRSDVYSLGVILYELLTGDTPLPQAEVRKCDLLTLGRRIEQEDAPRPSARIEDLARRDPAAASQIAAYRATTPGRLRDSLWGELDWITLRSLEKDPERRYQSAVDLAADIARHLADEVVTARPPTSTYRFGKFVRRHRGLLASGAAVSLAVVAALAISLDQANRAKRALGDSEHSRRQAEELVQFMIDDLAGELRRVGRLDSMRSSGDAVIRYFENSPAPGGDPESDLYRALALGQLSRIAADRGELDEAERLAEKSRDLQEDILTRPSLPPGIGPRAENGLIQVDQARGKLAYERMQYGVAEKLARESLERLRKVPLPDRSADFAKTEVDLLNNLALSCEFGGNPDDAVAFYRESFLKSWANSREGTDAVWLGAIAHSQHRLMRLGNSRESLFAGLPRGVMPPDPKECYLRMAAASGDDPNVLFAAAQGLRQIRESAFALPIYERLHLLEPNNYRWNRSFAHCLCDMGEEAYRGKGDLAQADLHFRKSAEVLDRLVGANPLNPSDQRLLGYLLLHKGYVSNCLGDGESARSELSRSVDLLESALAGSDDSAGTRFELGFALLRLAEITKDDKERLRLVLLSVQRLEEAGERDPLAGGELVAFHAHRLAADCLEKAGFYAQALASLEKSIEAYQEGRDESRATPEVAMYHLARSRLAEKTGDRDEEQKQRLLSAETYAAAAIESHRNLAMAIKACDMASAELKLGTQAAEEVVAWTRGKILPPIETCLRQRQWKDPEFAEALRAFADLLENLARTERTDPTIWYAKLVSARKSWVIEAALPAPSVSDRHRSRLLMNWLEWHEQTTTSRTSPSAILDEAVAFSSAWELAKPEDGDLVKALFTLHRTQADTRTDAAIYREHMDRAAEVMAGWIDRNAADASARETRAEFMRMCSDHWLQEEGRLDQRGDDAAALSVTEEALAILTGWLESAPPNRDLLTIRLGELQTRACVRLLDLGRTQEAESSARSAVATFRTGDGPSSLPGSEIPLATAHRHLSRSLMLQGRAADAKNEADTAVAILRTKAAASPADFAALGSLASALLWLGSLEKGTAPEEAIKHYEEAVTVSRTLLEAKPGSLNSWLAIAEASETLATLAPNGSTDLTDHLRLAYDARTEVLRLRQGNDRDQLFLALAAYRLSRMIRDDPASVERLRKKAWETLRTTTVAKTGEAAKALEDLAEGFGTRGPGKP